MKGTAKKTGRVWQIPSAKSQLGDVVEEAKKHGPQVLRRRGVDAAVVLSFEDYARLVKPKGSLVDFLTSSPLAGSELAIERSTDPPRPVDL
jgi:prevent-host-death family protein